MFPKFFGKISEEGVPRGAIATIGALATVGTLVGADVKNYAIFTVLGFMVFQLLVGVAVLRLPKTRPELLAQATFRLPQRMVSVAGIGLVASSAIFLVIGVSQSVLSTIIFCGFFGTGVLYYRKVARKAIKN